MIVAAGSFRSPRAPDHSLLGHPRGSKAISRYVGPPAPRLPHYFQEDQLMTINLYTDEPEAVPGDVVRDAVAAVRAFVDGDAYGAQIILRNTKTPRRMAGALAVLLGGMFIAGGETDPKTVEATLKAMTSAANAG